MQLLLCYEYWKEVEGYEGKYLISSAGRLKRIYKKGECRILKGKREKHGHIATELFKGGIGTQMKVHRLVALAFIPNPENKPCINHKNGIPYDNRVDNLEWCTQGENILHAYRQLGRIAWHKGLSKSPNNKPVIKMDIAGKIINGYTSITKAAQSVNGTMRSMSNYIGKNDEWIYKGHKWKFALQ